MTMAQTMTKVYSPDGKKSGNYPADEIPEGWLRTCPDKMEPVISIPEDRTLHISDESKEGDWPSQETEDEELARLQAEIDEMDAKEAAEAAGESER